MKKYTMEEFFADSYLCAGDYAEVLYDQYLEDPSSVDPEWRNYFASLGGVQDKALGPIETKFKQLASQALAAAAPASSKQHRVDALIDAYRRYGHFKAKLDPIGRPRPQDSRLSLSFHQLNDSDLNETFVTGGVLPQAEAQLKDIFSKLEEVYAGTLAVEFDFITDQAEQAWLRAYCEQQMLSQPLSQEQKLDVMRRLTASEGLEHYLAKKYVGQKRFSIEGGESLIPCMDTLIERFSSHSVKELLIGMAHRGRLNVQLNIMGRHPQTLFDEFDGKKDFGDTSGDVKYHMGYSTDLETPHGLMHLSLGYNPSHLSYVNTVEMGSVRARQDKHPEAGVNYAVPIIIHGDSAFSGLGVEMETLAMANTRAYSVGGSVHIVLNNQIGYTTDDPYDTRSSMYCTGLAKMIEAPILHVNCDDPEAVVYAARLAVEYRQRFHKDVVMDLVCYRRLGHNEGDEPSATSPMMYAAIRAMKTTRALYADQLIAEGVCTADDVKGMQKAYEASLRNNKVLLPIATEKKLSETYAAAWKKHIGQHWRDAMVPTTFALAQLKAVATALAKLPEGFTLQRQISKMQEGRAEMAAGKRPLDWGFAELLAYATLLQEGHSVRLSGEDAQRGTFAHRHACLHQYETGEQYLPLKQFESNEAQCDIYNSVLNETGTLGFEYGYSSFAENDLVIWEAQFGDFANGGQVIIDQFLSSAWQKWQRLAGLVMLLPHGSEGMGPEHSSARLERFLQLAAQDNIQVCAPTTPSQIFHLLRRQVLRPYRRPLIVMSPKSFLRHKLAVSSLDDLATGEFQVIMPEADDINPQDVKRVVLCYGKVYYDLLERRREKAQTDVAIIRIEQLYPFPYEEFPKILAQYTNAKTIVWCQEEPKNQGAWFTGGHRIRRFLQETQELIYVGREPMAAPAAGYPALHKKQQAALVEDALTV